MPYFLHDGLQFHYLDIGRGIPFVWQHGLGSDTETAFGVLENGAPFQNPEARLVGLDMRAHGQTRPLGTAERISFASYADDLASLLDHLNIEQAVVGGISMGSAVATAFALRHPHRVRGLILSRPAWLDQPLPDNLRIFPRIARYLADLGPEEGLRAFRATSDFAALERESVDCAQAIVSQFQNPRAVECAARLERIPNDAPSHDRRTWESISAPVLVLANQIDPIHPWSFAEAYAKQIPLAEFVELTPKSVCPDHHARDTQRAVGEFLTTHFLREGTNEERTTPPLSR